MLHHPFAELAEFQLLPQTLLIAGVCIGVFVITTEQQKSQITGPGGGLQVFCCYKNFKLSL